MAFIRANSGKALTVNQIAKSVGFSERYLRKAFRTVLNQSMVGVLQAEKIKRAKALLFETTLDIADVGFESGFENHANFAKVFREKVGITPSEFRKKAMDLKEIPESQLTGAGNEAEEQDVSYKDSFSDTGLGPNWRRMAGEWRCSNGTMVGSGAENKIAFLKPLPENCRITFQALICPIPNLSMPAISADLLDDSHKYSYCSFAVASDQRAEGELRHYREGRKRSARARINVNEWHALSLEIKEDTLRFSIDNIEVFSFRDSFQPAYSSRSFLHLSGWHCEIRIRAFVLQDLGFMPAAHPIKQGDALYNAGSHEKAMDFYVRFLRSGSASNSETMELRYKIGMCALRQKSFDAARNWIDKVVALKEEKFWAEQAELALMEIHWRGFDLDGFQEHMTHCLKNPQTSDSARVTIQLAVEDLALRGFVEEALEIINVWYELERQDEFARQRIQFFFSELLLMARKFKETEKVLLEIIQSSKADDDPAHYRINLMHLYFEWGKIEESIQVRRKIEADTSDSFVLARCKVHEALVWRTQEKFEQALEMLLSLGELFPLEETLICHGKIHAAQILCFLGKLEEAEKLFQEVKSVNSAKYFRCRYFLPLFLGSGDFAGAAELFLLEYRQTRDDILRTAEIGIKAGIMRELAGHPEKAREMYNDVSRRFPKTQVSFFGPFALVLSSGADFEADDMPCPHDRRSEMFYLLGLLKEKRGKKAAARELFEKCIGEDPTLRWPTLFATKKAGCG